MTKNEDITLRKLRDNELTKILDMISSDRGLKDTFLGKENTVTRVLFSDYAAMIERGNKPIGFIMLVNNTRSNVYEIDMGVLERYRNKGYGTAALRLLKEIISTNNLKVEVETRKENIGAIATVLRNGFILVREDDEKNYYTLPTTKRK